MGPVRPPKTPRKTPAKMRSHMDTMRTNMNPIAVYCRIRSLNNYEQLCIKEKDDKTVILYPPEESLNSRPPLACSFSSVFGAGTTQKQLFDHIAQPLIHDLLQGSNGLLFTYGITSSGKTYTMTGTPDDGGLLPRSLDVIFNSISDYQAEKYIFKPDKMNGFDVQTKAEALMDQQEELGVFNRTPKPKRRDMNEWSNRIVDSSIIEDVSSDMRYSVFISYVEIYNNYIYDLLEEESFDPKKRNMSSKMLREDFAHNMYVFGVNENEVKSVDEAMECFYKGQLKRKVANTLLNSESSRSHSVFTIRIVQAPLDSIGEEVLRDPDQIIISQLSLVDLAGSERQLRTRNVGHKLREAGNINNSLMALRNCIQSLRESQVRGNEAKMVQYRESKLTHLFKSFFEGKGKITMIVCVNPRADEFEENIHVMKFAEMTKEVMISLPTPISTPNTTGFRKGRGNRYRDALQRAKEEGRSVTEFLAPAVYILPEFPVSLYENEEDFDNLLEFLINYETRRKTFQEDLARRHDDFRMNLIVKDKENIQLKNELSILEKDLRARNEQLLHLEQKLASSEEQINSSEGRNNDLEKRLFELRHQLEEKNEIVIQQDQEVQEIRNKMQEKLAFEKDKMRRIMERRLAEKQAELEGKLCFNGEKFRLLREILNAGDWEYLMDFNGPLPAPASSTGSSELTVPQTRSKRRSSLSENSQTEVKLPKSRSAVDFLEGTKKSGHQSSTQQSKNDFDSLFAKENKPPGTSQRSIAIANLRHRRSHSSSGDKWVEHKPIGNLELNTVLQPTMKKRKSVSKLKVKDVTSKDVSKYVLEHQEQDSQGEVETQFYKGDIIPSAGGGAQVVFSDVEKLRQESPPSASYNLRKRSSDGLPLREIEDRCTVAVECHGLPSKIMKKK